MTESEEMYLVTIARLKEHGTEGYIPLSQLSGELNVLAPSANQMIRKLEEAGYVSYVPYKGVDLTAEGQQLALQVLRHRRLWEVFLVEHLKIGPEDAHSLADRMEHIIPMEAAERLAEFLGNPLFGPQGEPIPRPAVDASLPMGVALNQLTPGESGTVTQVLAEPAERSFLASEGILPGQAVTILASGCKGALLLETGTGGTVHLSEALAKTICIRPQVNPTPGPVMERK